MIVREFYAVRADGVDLYRTSSDEGKYITRDGEKYAEAIDPDGTDRVYEETDETIPGWDEPAPEDDPESEEEDDEGGGEA